MAQTDRVALAAEAAPWGILVGMHGGDEESCLAAGLRGEWVEVENPAFETMGGPETLFKTVSAKGQRSFYAFEK